MIAPSQRHRRANPCPICGGFDTDRRGRGERCYGFDSDDGRYAYCSREEYAGTLACTGPRNTFRHYLAGPCHCGADHSTGSTAAPALARPRTSTRPDSMPASATPPTQAHLRAEPTAIYTYRALETGAPLRKLRYGTGKGKRFVWQRIGRIGDAMDWIDGRGDAVPDAYGAEILPDADPFEPLFITEGEKDRDLIAALGGLAISPPDGTGSWSAEYNRLARGRQAVVCVDADTPGRQHAEQEAQMIASAPAATVRLLTFDDAHDVGDWLSEGHTYAELRRLAAAAPVIFSACSPQTQAGLHALQDETCAEVPNSRSQNCPRCAALAADLQLARTSLATLRRERMIENEYLMLPPAKLSAPLQVAAIAIRRELKQPTWIRERDERGLQKISRTAIAKRLGVNEKTASKYLREVGKAGVIEFHSDPLGFGERQIVIGEGPNIDTPAQIAEPERAHTWGGAGRKKVKACPHCYALGIVSTDFDAICRTCSSRMHLDELIDVEVAIDADDSAPQDDSPPPDPYVGDLATHDADESAPRSRDLWLVTPDVADDVEPDEDAEDPHAQPTRACVFCGQRDDWVRNQYGTWQCACRERTRASAVG